MAGMKCALMVPSDARALGMLDSFPQEVASRTSILGLHAHVADYGDGEWLDFRDLGFGTDPAERVLQDATVALDSGPAFGAVGRGHARINFACDPSVLEEAVETMSTLQPRASVADSTWLRRLGTV